MNNTVVIGIIIFVVWMVYLILARHRKKHRSVFIDQFPYPKGIHKKVLEKYPHLTESDLDLVMTGLKTYFDICNQAGRKMVSMPSQVVDEAWHQFILYTRPYQIFCRKSFGRFLHHNPAEGFRSGDKLQEGIRRAWRLSCQKEGIAPKMPNTLPLLFGLDQQLNIPDGFKYSVDCKKDGSEYCAGSIGCGGSSCGGDSGCSSCSSGCGGD